MTRLEELIISLATVIVRYHDSYNAATAYNPKGATEALTRKSSFDYSKKLLEKNELQSKLSELVNKCPKNDRGPFLDFIKDELLVLKERLNKAQPFTSGEFELYQKQMTQLVVDFIKLLNTNKGTTYDVQCNNPLVKISLGGLNNVGFGLLASSLCKSGQLLTEEILTRFNFSTAEEATEWAKELCNEHQNKLLATSAPALVTRNTALEEENKSLQETMKKNAATLDSLFQITKKMELDLKQSQTDLSETKTQLATVQKDNGRLRSAQTSMSAQTQELTYNLTTQAVNQEKKSSSNPNPPLFKGLMTTAGNAGLFSHGRGGVLMPPLIGLMKRTTVASPPETQVMDDSAQSDCAPK